MKKLLVAFCLMMLGVSYLPAREVTLYMGIVDHTPTMPGNSKSPTLPWCIDLDGYVLTMPATPCDYTLNLYDEDGEVVYSVFVFEGTTQVVLPSTLSGYFEIRFETDTYYYYGYIYL